MGENLINFMVESQNYLSNVEDLLIFGYYNFFVLILKKELIYFTFHRLYNF